MKPGDVIRVASDNGKRGRRYVVKRLVETTVVDALDDDLKLRTFHAEECHVDRKATRERAARLANGEPASAQKRRRT